MIALLRGDVAARATDHVVVDVGGVGYLVHVPTSLADRVPPRGQPVELHTTLVVREDAMTLYGFPDAVARDLFGALLTASGVGPKLALAALSTMSPPALRNAIVEGDVAALCDIPGIGKKSAQRLVLELGEKLGGLALAEVGLDGAAAGAVPVDAMAEVRAALRQLGYSASETQLATAGLDAAGEVGDLLKQALHNLSFAGAN